MRELPESPNGYTEPKAVPRSLLSSVVWMILVAGGSLLVYTPGIRQSLIVSRIGVILEFEDPIQLLFPIIIVLFIAFINTVIHEKVHEIASGMVGYHSEVKLKPMLHGKNPYNYISGNWIDVGEYQLITLAPLFVINLFAASLVIMAVSPIATVLGKVVLVVNTVTSGDDIRMFVRGLRSDDSTKYYHDIDGRALAVYESVEIDE